MVDGTLGTTNILLGILAAVSVLEAVALACILVVTVRVYMRALETLRDVQHQLLPLTERVNQIAVVVEGVAVDVKDMTGRAAAGAEGVGVAFQTAIEVVDLVRGTTRGSVASRVVPLLGIVQGLRVAYKSFVNSGRRHVHDSFHPINDITEVVHGA